MENRISFQDYAIVACGTLNMELNRLKDSGFLDTRKILYTKPGRHEVGVRSERTGITVKSHRQISKGEGYQVIIHRHLVPSLGE